MNNRSEESKKSFRAEAWPPYNPHEIEPRWHKAWEESGIYQASQASDKPKYYCLDFFPYPSGEGLHVGHCRNYIPTDVISRYKRMRGFNVLHPMGWDSFGEPAEQFAIAHGVHPRLTTERNTANFRRQMTIIGTSYDWSREIDSSKPEFYQWTQWFFLLLYRRGLAYRDMHWQWWCPTCQTTLSSHEVVGGVCWRGHSGVTKKEIPAWYFKITAYADELLSSLDTIDWPEHIKAMQRNWIGKSQGCEIVFETESGAPVPVFTTRPDTIYGATFFVLAPEHPLVKELTGEAQRAQIEAYVAQAASQSEMDRLAETREKTGLFTGGYVINPVNGERVPAWIADYVLPDYGTGAVMGVPAHDQRDFSFALKYGLPILPVIERPDGLTRSFAVTGSMQAGFSDALRSEDIPFTESADGGLYITIPKGKVDRYIDIAQAHIQPGFWNEVIGTRWVFIFSEGRMVWDSTKSEEAILIRCKELEPNVRDVRTLMEMLWGCEFYRDALYHDSYGTMINSGGFSGTEGDTAMSEVIQWLEAHGKGKPAVNYRMRDWLISRQRYWGAPIPILYCDRCGEVPVPEDQLPVLLPPMENFEPDGSGRSPLARLPEFVNTTCPKCGGPARRETDTMGGFADSSWYFLRFTNLDYGNPERGPIDPDAVPYWMPVDLYVGGAEHAVLHLLYSRFWTKVMADAGLVTFREPFARLLNQGQLMGPDGRRMSKSRGNVITPDSMVEAYGADALRVYELFMAPFDQDIDWSTEGINGARRFINRIWTLYGEAFFGNWEAKDTDPEVERLLHKTIRKVSERIESFRFNTMISALMEFVNFLSDRQRSGKWTTASYHRALEVLLVLLAPAAPHIAEEMWQMTGHHGSVHQQPWPAWDEDLARDEFVQLAIQVNSKVRDVIEVLAGAGQEEIESQVYGRPKIQQHLAGREIAKVFYVPGRILNIVTRKG